MKGVPNCFIALWCILMPLTSFLLVRSVQGTIPAYVLGFFSVFFVVLSRSEEQPNVPRMRYFQMMFLVAGIWLLLLCGSQLGHILSNRHDFGDMFLNSPGDTRVVLRSVLFTQTLYLAACLCIALFFRFFFRPEWMRYVLWGGWFLALYGIYEWLFFLIFQQTGDFIANRTYGEDLQTGSWSQVIQMGPFSLLRIKSTFGEPSFLSAAVVPYLFLALEYKRKWLSAALLFCVVFSTSTSAYIALPFAIVIYSFFRRRLSWSIGIVLLLFIAMLGTLYFAFPDTFEGMFTAKLSGANGSGEIHQSTLEAMYEAMQTFTVMNRIFGIGFGYFYGSVFNAVLVNTGWIGMFVYLYAFLKPAILLRPSDGGLALKVGVATIFFLYCVNVSELFLPTTWMFLGLAYWRLDQQKREKKASELGSIRTPVPVG
ncbi:MAG: hypothetical protein JO279_17780 [Verrucomicrobia bacterium]|nr:hypothetical protein [Verrucomicrobiota bacterium]